MNRWYLFKHIENLYGWLARDWTKILNIIIWIKLIFFLRQKKIFLSESEFFWLFWKSQNSLVFWLNLKLALWIWMILKFQSFCVTSQVEFAYSCQTLLQCGEVVRTCTLTPEIIQKEHIENNLYPSTGKSQVWHMPNRTTI